MMLLMGAFKHIFHQTIETNGKQFHSAEHADVPCCLDSLLGELYDIVDGWLAGAWGDVQAHHPDWDIAHWRTRWHAPKHASAWLRAVAVAERCSGIIKVTGDLSDLFIGHATWDSFTNVGLNPSYFSEICVC